MHILEETIRNGMEHLLHYTEIVSVWNNLEEEWKFYRNGSLERKGVKRCNGKMGFWLFFPETRLELNHLSV